MTLLAPLAGLLSPLGVAGTRPKGVESAYALGFDGSTADMRAAVGNLGSCTVSFWIKLNTDLGSHYIFDARKDLGSGYVIFGGGALSVSNGTVYVDGRQTTAISLGVWHHVVITGITINAPTTLIISGRNDSPVGGIAGERFNGLIDDLRFYSNLTTDQISALYNNVTPPPTSELIRHWAFEEGTGVTTVDSVGSLSASLNGEVKWQPQVPPRLIRDRNTEDWSLSFDGVNDYVTIPDSPSLSFTSNVTFAAWIKATNLANSRALIRKGSAAGADITWLWYLRNGTQLSFFTSAGERGATFSPITNMWYHVCTVVDSGNNVFHYVNGSLLSHDYVSGGSSTWVDDLHPLNIANWSSFYFSGLIKDPRIYNTALSSASIAKLARGVEPTEVGVARWRLNEGTGTTANDSIGTNHGTLTNGPTYSGDVPQWHRQAIVSTQSLGVLDGVDDEVRVADSVSLDLTSLVTISAWVYVTSLPASQGRIISKGLNKYLLYVDSLGSPVFYLTGPSELGMVFIGVLQTGRWYHLAGTYNSAGGSNNRNTYLNGVLDRTRTNTGDVTVDNSELTLGSYEGGGFRLHGLIDEACIYNRAQSAAEVADSAAGYLVTAGLVARYKMDGNANDSAGSNHGVEQGGVGYSTNVPGTL